MVRRALLLPLTLILGVLAPALSARAQAPGYAEITSPRPGASVEGLVSIEGTADHPAFVSYDLAFAPDPISADTWFPLGAPVETRARQSALGLFDTSTLTPGLYQIRLRVHLDGGSTLEHTVRSLRVGLAPLPATPTFAARPGQAVASATPTPEAAAPPAPPAPPVGRDPVGLALAIGGVTAAALLVGLGILVPLRRSMAAWAGSMRMRRLHRREQRRRRSMGQR